MCVCIYREREREYTRGMGGDLGCSWSTDSNSACLLLDFEDDPYSLPESSELAICFCELFM